VEPIYPKVAPSAGQQAAAHTRRHGKQPLSEPWRIGNFLPRVFRYLWASIVIISNIIIVIIAITIPVSKGSTVRTASRFPALGGLWLGTSLPQHVSITLPQNSGFVREDWCSSRQLLIIASSSLLVHIQDFSAWSCRHNIRKKRSKYQFPVKLARAWTFGGCRYPL
jgi:hypothetical protein